MFLVTVITISVAPLDDLIAIGNLRVDVNRIPR